MNTANLTMSAIERLDGSSVETPVSERTSRIPLWAKLGYTAFVVVLVPYYLKTYGPTNFLYFATWRY